MSIYLRRDTMSSPSCMRNAKRSTCIFTLRRVLQITNLTLCFEDIQTHFFIDNCNTCTIISTVFQPVKSFYQYRISLTLSYVSYYSTHFSVVFISKTTVLSSSTSMLCHLPSLISSPELPSLG